MPGDNEGSPNESDPRATTEAAEAALASDTRLARQLADAALAIATDAELRVRSLRVLAVASGTEGRAAEGLRFVDAALVAAAEAPELRAQVQRVRASALLANGRVDEALVAAQEAKALARDDEMAHILVMEATLLGATGRIDEALETFASVERQLLPDQHFDRANLCMNRAVFLSEAGRVREAAADLTVAAQLYRRLDHDVHASHAQLHLALASAQIGDIPQLFRLLGALRPTLEHGDPRTVADLGAALTLARLDREAMEVLGPALPEIDRSPPDRVYPRIALMAAAACRRLGRETQSQELAERASELAVEVGDRTVEIEAQLLLMVDAPSAAALPLIDELHERGRTDQALYARLTVARRAIAHHRPTLAIAALTPISEPDEDQAASTRSRQWLAIARRSLLVGDLALAERALRLGIEAAEQLMALLGSFELRAHHARTLAALAETAIELAERRGDPPATLLEQVELGRAAALSFGPTPTAQARVAELLDRGRELRGTTRSMDMLGEHSSEAARELASVERQILDLLRSDPSLAPDHRAGFSSSELAARLGDRTFVSFHQRDERLHAITVTDGDFAEHILPMSRSEAADSLQAIENAAARLASGRQGRLAEAAMALIATELEKLDHGLFGDLDAIVDGRPLVLSPSGQLRALPWNGLPSLQTAELEVTPSARLWLDSREVGANTPPRQPVGAVQVFSGPNLDSGDSEAALVGAAHEDAVVYTGEDATTANVLLATATAHILHLACHGRFRADNPMFSELQMADGPLWLTDLARLNNAPELVVLGACDGGRAWIGPAEDEIGIGTQFLLLGARSVIAPLWITNDDATTDLMAELHTQLAAGHPPARALQLTATRYRDQSPAHHAAALALVCLGAGQR